MPTTTRQEGKNRKFGKLTRDLLSINGEHGDSIHTSLSLEFSPTSCTALAHSHHPQQLFSARVWPTNLFASQLFFDSTTGTHAAAALPSFSCCSLCHLSSSLLLPLPLLWIARKIDSPTPLMLVCFFAATASAPALSLLFLSFGHSRIIFSLACCFFPCFVSCRLLSLL